MHSYKANKSFTKRRVLQSDACIITAGVDEAGRGPLAGPVVAAAVVLHPAHTPDGIADSKTLSRATRVQLFDALSTHARIGIGIVGPERIDEVNILNATLEAMAAAIGALTPPPAEILVDGLHCPPVKIPARAIVKGDTKIPAIAAASIIAKETRDRLMEEEARRFPGYGFERHFGYPTRAHKAALARLGPAPCHRRSFAPVRACLNVS